MKRLLLATAMSVACLSSAHATDYRFFCTNQSHPAVNPDHDGVFVAVTSGTAQSFDVVHTISKHLYNRQDPYKVTSITHPAANSYFWEGSMLNDPHVIMTGHLWENDGVWMYTENQTFTDAHPPKMATPPVVCRNTIDLRQAVNTDERPSSAHATDYRFFCTNQSDPAVNLDHDGVFVAIEYGTDQSFDVVHTISKQRYNRQNQYKVTSITHPAVNSYLWVMLNDPRVIMTGHLWEK